jgi:ATP-dependent DNA helicase PIF1
MLQAGPGRGKTYLLQTLTHLLRGSDRVVVTTASTAIAACRYQAGSTAHRFFKLPLQTAHGQCTQDSKSIFSELLIKADAIILDEIVSLDYGYIDMIDNHLQWLLNTRQRFGGKIFIGAGDFEQILPIVPNSYHEMESVYHTIKYANSWPSFTNLTLFENCRCRYDSEYAQFVDEVGVGLAPTVEPKFQDYHHVILDNRIKTTTNEDEMYNFIYPNLEDQDVIPRGKISAEGLIMAPLNQTVDKRNLACLKRLPTPAKTYRATNIPPNNLEKFPELFSPEYLWAYKQNGVPNSSLELKEGAIVMIVRNLISSIGLNNGTKAIVTELFQHFIEVETIPAEPNEFPIKTFLPRIIFEVTTDEGVFHRRQFPIRLAYAATVNKAQSQTIKKVVYDIEEADSFAHGQCHVAFSRVRKRDDILVLKRENQTLANIVHREVFPSELQERIRNEEQRVSNNNLHVGNN